jgi:succinyl-CoA synthetase beta subunit/citryl-CoA synthetase large subunit
MHFYEFEAKKILAKHGVGVPKGKVASSAAEAESAAKELGGDVLVKAQVFNRNRGKAGGVKEVSSPADAGKAAAAMLGTEICGATVECVLVEEKIAAEALYAVNATYDAAAKRPIVVATDVGGKDLDDVNDETPDRVKRRHYSSLVPVMPYRSKQLASDLGLNGSALNRMTAVITKLAEICRGYDLTHAEVNALAVTADGRYIALDAHMELESEGRYRQKEIVEELDITDADTRGARAPTKWEVEAQAIDDEDPRGLIGPAVEFDGDMGLVIGAGGGSITTFDAVKRLGGDPANYAALGGNPSVDKARRLTQLVLSKPKVNKICVISNVVSNTRADLVARGVIKGCIELGLDPAETITIFRVPGAWEGDAIKILKKYNIDYCDRTVSLSEAARRAVAKVYGEKEQA